MSDHSHSVTTALACAARDGVALCVDADGRRYAITHLRDDPPEPVTVAVVVPPASSPNPRWGSTIDAARLIGVHRDTLVGRAMECEGRGGPQPPYVHRGKGKKKLHRQWNLDDVPRWWAAAGAWEREHSRRPDPAPAPPKGGANTSRKSFQDRLTHACGGR